MDKLYIVVDGIQHRNFDRGSTGYYLISYDPLSENNGYKLFDSELKQYRKYLTENQEAMNQLEAELADFSDDHLELLLIDENKWIESLEEEHLLKLQEKLNNYIYFLESKQYVARYGDSFDKKVIHITFQYSPSDNGLAFLAAVQKVLQNTDMILKIELPE